MKIKVNNNKLKLFCSFLEEHGSCLISFDEKNKICSNLRCASPYRTYKAYFNNKITFIKIKLQERTEKVDKPMVRNWKNYNVSSSCFSITFTMNKKDFRVFFTS